MARGGVDGNGRRAARRARPVAARRRIERGRQGHGRLSVPDRHDAACRGRAPRRAVRLGCRACGESRQGIADATVPAGLSHRHGRDHLSVQRRDRGGVDAGGIGGGQKSGYPPTAAAVRVRVHRQRGELRAADFQSGQPRSLRQSHARARSVAGTLCTAFATVDPRHLRRFVLDAAAYARWVLPHKPGTREAQRQWSRGTRRHRHDRGRIAGGVGVRQPARLANRLARCPHGGRRAAALACLTLVITQTRVVERAAAGRWFVRSCRNTRSHRSHPRTREHAREKPPRSRRSARHPRLRASSRSPAT